MFQFLIGIMNRGAMNAGTSSVDAFQFLIGIMNRSKLVKSRYRRKVSIPHRYYESRLHHLPQYLQNQVSIPHRYYESAITVTVEQSTYEFQFLIGIMNRAEGFKFYTR